VSNIEWDSSLGSGLLVLVEGDSSLGLMVFGAIPMLPKTALLSTTNVYFYYCSTISSKFLLTNYYIVLNLTILAPLGVG
jgi:hypothetical protein